MKPLSAAPVEGSPDRKQPRSSLSTALSSGLEKLKTVTSGSVQPVALASQISQTVDTKRLKVSLSRMPRETRPDMWCCGERSGIPRSETGCWAGWSKEQTRSHTQGPGAIRLPLALETEAAPGDWSVGGWAGGPAGLLTFVPSDLRIPVCWTSRPSTTI